MNKPLVLSLLVVSFIALAGIALGEDLLPTPKPPFIAPVPDNTIMTIKITNQASAAKSPTGARIVTQLISTKSGPTRELVSEWSDGSRSETWFSSGYRIDQDPGNGAIMITPLHEYQDPQSGDFFDLRWLKLSNYVGIEDQNGKSCFHFKTQIDMKEQRIIVDYSAFIDVKTSRPVAWSVGPNHFEMASIVPRDASNPLVLPETLARQLKAYRTSSALPNAYSKP